MCPQLQQPFVRNWAIKNLNFAKLWEMTHRLKHPIRIMDLPPNLNP